MTDHPTVTPEQWRTRIAARQIGVAQIMIG